MTDSRMSSPGSRQRPRVEVVEEGMREGMQIENAGISVADKVRLLDALSSTGLQHIVVGSFVSPKWVPQMAAVEEVIAGFTPREGVTYTALALNQRGVERRSAYVPPLAGPDGIGRSMLHLCDVFIRRNTARSCAEELAALPQVVARAVDEGAREATVAVNAAWGSNWLGPFSAKQRVEALDVQMTAWAEAGIETTGVYFGDPMSWNTPTVVAEQVAEVVERWPAVRVIHLHLHDARGAALTSAYAALGALDGRHTLIVDSSIGGMGGCPYCGNGRATKMIPTEDLVSLLEGEGIDTGIDVRALIEAAHLAEEVVGHELYGRTSKGGPRPEGADLYPMDMPLVETIEEAQHFRLGPDTYAGRPAPWTEPVQSEARDVVERALGQEEGT